LLISIISHKNDSFNDTVLLLIGKLGSGACTPYAIKCLIDNEFYKAINKVMELVKNAYRDKLAELWNLFTDSCFRTSKKDLPNLIRYAANKYPNTYESASSFENLLFTFSYFFSKNEANKIDRFEECLNQTLTYLQYWGTKGMLEEKMRFLIMKKPIK